MKKAIVWAPLRALAIALAGLSVGACVGNVSGQLTLPAEQAKSASYYVQRHDKDPRDLASTIAQTMQKRGLKATAGVESAHNADVPYVVTYVDKWMWDMRMYLYSLRIEVRDAKDMSIVGYGESMQSSLKAMGQTHEDIIDKALDKMFPR